MPDFFLGVFSVRAPRPVDARPTCWPVCWDVSVNQPPDQSRPDFEPPPRRPLIDSAVQESEPSHRRRIGTRPFRRPVISLLLLAAVALTVFLLHRSADDSSLDRPQRPSAVAPPTLTHPLPTPGARPSEPLLQQRWSPADDVYPMDLRGLSFSFRAPGSWGCLASPKAGVRWVCTDQTGLLNGIRPAEPSGGVIESDECKAPCTAKGYADVRSRLHALGIDTTGLHVVDNRTRIDDRVDPADPALREYRMSRTYDSDGDGTLDRHLWVQIDLNAADRIPVQKMLGDIYDATR